VEIWPTMAYYTEYSQMATFRKLPNNLEAWYKSTGATNVQGLHLLNSLFQYDPLKRITAKEAILHPYFAELPKLSQK
jgi:cyclin-dependent kinase 8/11